MEKNIEQKVPIFKKPWVHSLISFIVIFGLLIVFLFWQMESNTVFIENSNLEAPIINLAPSSAGVLNALYVKEGDTVKKGDPLIKIDDSVFPAPFDGTVTFLPYKIGEIVYPQSSALSLVDLRDRYLVVSLDRFWRGICFESSLWLFRSGRRGHQ